MGGIPADRLTVLGDAGRYPGCRVVLACSACSWSKAYDPERITARLKALGRGGPATRVSDVARSVQWNCPACGRMRWRTRLGRPASA